MIKESTYPFLGREDVFVMTTRDGSNTLFNKSYYEPYHSLYGAVSESRHTYIQYCLMTQSHLSKIRILEFGFGTGLNAFLSFLFAEKHNIKVDYLGFEAYPLEKSIYSQLDYPAYLASPQHEPIFYKMHEKEAFSTSSFHFQRKDQWNIESFTSAFDCIYFDAFAPAAQPELWQQEMFDALYNATANGGCLVTYCSKGDVRRRMLKAGYLVQRIHGAPGKREMLQAVKVQQ
jgi:tRNA U34 5-methylaminomethyl-2-thiouridine-forming methyltransferase MnmC